MRCSAALLQERPSDYLYDRRAFLGAAFAIASLASTATAQVTPGARETDIIDFQWELPRRYAGRAAQYLGVDRSHIFAAPETDATRGGPVIVIIIAALLLVALARALVAFYRDVRYGGLIVQDTERGFSIRYDRRIPDHVIIIRDRNGVTVHELRDEQVNVRDLAPLLENTRAARAR